MTATPHDALFKAAFSQVAYAAEELRHVLPPELVAGMDFSSLSLEAGSFVDEALRERHTDLLYSLRVGGRDALIYVLFEHQSSGDPWMALRMLGYMLRIWDSRIAAGATVLPVVIPVVLHHGAAGWSAATHFEGLFDMPPGAAPFTPHFRFALDDLGATSEAELHRRAVSAYTRLVLSALQQSRGEREVRRLLLGWRSLIGEVLRAPDGEGALALVFRYLFEVRGAEEFAAIDTTVREIEGVRREVMQTIAEMLESRGMERGRQEGQREMLLSLLEQRFGELPGAVRQRVDAARSAEIDRWSRRLLTAGDLDEVFVAS